MEEFTLYGIENEKFQKLERMLRKVLADMGLNFKLVKINDIDIIVRSGISSIPSLFFKEYIISSEVVPDEMELKNRIAQLIAQNNSDADLRKAENS